MNTQPACCNVHSILGGWCQAIALFRDTYLTSGFEFGLAQYMWGKGVKLEPQVFLV